MKSTRAEALALGTLSGAVAVLVGFAAGLLLRIVWIEWLEARSVRARDIR